MASPAIPLRRKAPGKHAGDPTPVTAADVVAFFFLKAAGKHVLMLVAPKGSKFSDPIPGEMENRHLIMAAEEPAPTPEAEKVSAPPVVDEYGYIEEPQPVMA
jgi:hypothetical protein